MESLALMISCRNFQIINFTLQLRRLSIMQLHTFLHVCIAFFPPLPTPSRYRRRSVWKALKIWKVYACLTPCTHRTQATTTTTETGEIRNENIENVLQWNLFNKKHKEREYPPPPSGSRCHDTNDPDVACERERTSALKNSCRKYNKFSLFWLSNTVVSPPAQPRQFLLGFNKLVIPLFAAVQPPTNPGASHYY